MKRTLALLVFASLFVSSIPTRAVAVESSSTLKEGDLISAIFSDDPDVYIINEHGFKRLFLNPEIFKFYGHLGGFANVKLVTPEVRDSYITSGYFRDCETDDKRVYGVSVEEEDKGTLHWVDTPGEQAVRDDADFFRKVFCINNREFAWYPKGREYKSVKEVPPYGRGEEKVTICHEGHTIAVAKPALEAHLAHGDMRGVCPGTTPKPEPTPKPSKTPTPTPSHTPTPTPTPTPEILPTLIEDNFNSYDDGLLWGQGDWDDGVNGESFIVQSASVKEGAQAVSNSYGDGPAIINKKGATLSDGRQSLYFKTVNRDGWTENEDGNVQIRITKGAFHPAIGNPYSGNPSMNSPQYHPDFFVAMTLRKDGHVTYYDPVTSSFKEFATYDDDEWTRLEVEWQSDGTARYRVGAGEWTSWRKFYGGDDFTSFDTINLIKDNRVYYGSGEVYFDKFY